MVTSKLLLDENPLLIMPKLACKIGLNESIVIQQIHYWTQINEKTENNFIDGYYWTYNSYPEWQEQFPFWSTSTIQRIIVNLEKLKLIKVSNYNKMNMDRTKWYRIDYDKLKTLENQPLRQNDIIDDSKLIRTSSQVDTNKIAKRNEQDSNLTSPIPKTTPKTTPKTSSKNNNISSSFEEVVLFYEEHINLLTDDLVTQRLKKMFEEVGIDNLKKAILETEKSGMLCMAIVGDFASKYEVKNNNGKQAKG